MSDSDPGGLLDRARQARAQAISARRLANQQPDDHTRDTLLRFADEMEATATALEQQAFNIIPPVIQKHATPQQMAQAQITPTEPDESDKKPTNPD